MQSVSWRPADSAKTLGDRAEVIEAEMVGVDLIELMKGASS